MINKKIYIFSFVLSILIFIALRSDLYSINNGNREELKKSLLNLWAEKECATDELIYFNRPLISIACTGNYPQFVRNGLLDILYQNGLRLIKESYQIEKKSGLYLYKTEPFNDKGNYIYIKVYVRDARILWPENEKTRPMIALFVNNADSHDVIRDWQGLGISLTFGLKSDSLNFQEMAERVISYKQELWISINMETGNHALDNTGTLTIEDAHDNLKLSAYLDRLLINQKNITGVASVKGDLFLKDIISLRNLFRILRAKGIHYYLDTSIQTSVQSGYDTAKIMSLNAYQTDAYLQENSDLIAEWNILAQKAKEKGYVIIVAEASSKKTKNFLHENIKRLRQDVDFNYLSELPVIK